ncbi:MAG: hypothetical protein Q9186_003269 [Xanthomendoza sp. 1 TL-2023]
MFSTGLVIESGITDYCLPLRVSSRSSAGLNNEAERLREQTRADQRPTDRLDKRETAHNLEDQAVGLLPAEKGGVTLITKRTKHQNRPAANRHEVTFAGNKSGPKVYRGIVNYTAKQNYRADLRQEAVARASAIRESGRPKKETPEKKLRGAKGKAAEAESS